MASPKKLGAPKKEELDEERLCEAVMVILQNVPGKELNIVLVNKALFYADLVALRDHGKTITGASYLGYKQGPVVANYKNCLVKALEQRGWARQQVYLRSKRRPLAVKKPMDNYPKLTTKQLSILSGIGKKIADETSTSISALSHHNLAWKIAYAKGSKIGRKPIKLNMMLALQQLPLDEDAWLATPATDQEIAACAAMDDEKGVAWL